MSPAAVMCFMRCTTLGRWSVTWRTGRMDRWKFGPSSRRKQATAERRHGRKDQSLARKISYARTAEAKAIALADEVALLAQWLRDDILSVAGPESAVRRDLLDFVVAELRRETACPDRIRPVRTLLENQRDNLLAFAVDLDRELAALAQEWQISVTTAGKSCRCNPCDVGPEATTL